MIFKILEAIAGNSHPLILYILLVVLAHLDTNCSALCCTLKELDLDLVPVVSSLSLQLWDALGADEVHFV